MPTIATARAVLSSDALVKDTETLQLWLTDARAAAAVEMELAGVYSAARKPRKEYPILAIRGISDVVGFRRDEKWTAYACHTAASFAHALLRSGATDNLFKKKSVNSRHALLLMIMAGVALVSGTAICYYHIQRNQPPQGNNPSNKLNPDDELKMALAETQELLAFFASNPPPHVENPTNANEWLDKIYALFKKTQTDAGKSLIRENVRKFCADYIPIAAQLDTMVMIEDKLIPRSNVIIVYDSFDEKNRGKALSNRVASLNEFNFEGYYPKFDMISWNNMSHTTGRVKALKPTQKSLIARDFSQARKSVVNWSIPEILKLAKICGGEGRTEEEKRTCRELTDELIGDSPAGVSGAMLWTEANTKIWSRFKILSKFPALFDSDL
jgi:hypothetical protein